VELTREVARRFNALYKTAIFPEPEALFTPVPKVPGTDGRKMSKSYGNTIGLTEAPASATAKVQGMSTGGQRTRQSDAGDPDLCPVGDIHKVFSTPEIVAETQKGCRTATMRCEQCKMEAAQSVCAVTGPIHSRRMELESKIDATWEMLCEQSARAAKRAEQTMLEVREVFDLSHDLGSIRQHFLASAEDRSKAHDLSQHAEWWKVAPDEQSKNLRDYWRSEILPRDIPLSQESNRVFPSLERELEEPFISARKKRVLLSSISAQQDADGWHFQIPAKSYEVWTLLCWHGNYWLDDFVIPQKFFAQPFAKAKKIAKDKPIHLLVRKAGDRWVMEFVDLPAQAAEPIDITDLLGNYEPLK
jgi:tryptophanyl-tRNA synthetase